MALVLKDRVQQTGTANTTVSFTLSGSVTGFQSFSAIGNGNVTFYTATDTSGNWEVGVGTYSSTGPTLTRTSILASSNSGSAVTFSGAVNVWCDYPAKKSVNQDANGAVNILTNVPNTTTNIGTLNVGDGTYNFAQLGQLASFASSEPVVNSVSIQNTSTSNTAYSSIQLGANNYNTGYFLELGTNSSTYSYSAAGYPNSSINQPNVNYILANKADLGIATWDTNNIHFIQNASSATTDSMTMFYDGGVSLGGFGSPGLGSMSGNKFVPAYTAITSAAGTTVLTSASTYYQRVTGTLTQTVQMPDATTLLQGTTYVIDNDSTVDITLKDGATTTFDTIASGSLSYIYLISNATVAGTWARYHFLPNSYDFGTTSANFGGAVISNTTYQGNAIAPAYGGTGLTGFGTSDQALYSTSATTLTAGTLPSTAGGTGMSLYTQGDIIVAANPYALTVIPAFNSGTILQSNGVGATPTWSDTINLTGSITVPNLYITSSSSNQVFYSGSGGAVISDSNFTYDGTTVNTTYDMFVNNVHIGLGGGSNTSNTVVGFLAFDNNSYGTSNTAFGSYALSNSNGGTDNTAIGSYALSSLGNRYENTAVGSNALANNSYGSDNTAVGAYALNSNFYGNNNTVVGAYAGGNGFNSSQNVFLGYASGQNMNGNNNSFIGSFTGSNATLNITNASNFIVLSDGAEVVKQIIDGDGNVGFNDDQPWYYNLASNSSTLTYSNNNVSNAAIGMGVATPYSYPFTEYTYINSSQRGSPSSSMPLEIQIGGYPVMSFDASGYIGIGAPPDGTHLLYLNGDVSFTSNLTVGYTVSGEEFVLNGATSGFTPVQGIYTPAYGSMAFSTNNGERMRIDSTGNVGIGTSSPGTKLQVVNTGSTDTRIGVGNATSGLQIGVDSTGACLLANFVAQPISMYTNGAERMRITALGGISFGNTGTAYGTSGQVLQSNGNAAPTWVAAPGASAGGAIYENSQIISSNYTMTTGKNGESVGPITIASGITVTIPTGSRWVVL